MRHCLHPVLCVLFLVIGGQLFADSMLHSNGKDFPAVYVETIQVAPDGSATFGIRMIDDSGTASEPHPVKSSSIQRLQLHDSQAPQNPPVGRLVNIQMRDGKYFDAAELIGYIQANGQGTFYLRPPGAAAGSNPFPVAAQQVTSIGFVNSGRFATTPTNDPYQYGSEDDYDEYGDDDEYYDDDYSYSGAGNGGGIGGNMLIIARDEPSDMAVAGYWVTIISLFILNLWMIGIFFSQEGASAVAVFIPCIGTIAYFYFLAKCWGEAKVPFLISIPLIIVNVYCQLEMGF